MQAHDDILTRLWSAAQAMFERMRAAIGEADALAGRRDLDAEEAQAVRKWLGPLEAMVRKVVLVHALALIERGDTHAKRKRGDTHARPVAAQLPAPSDVRVCHPAAPAPAPPAVTLIALPPPPVRLVSQAAAAATPVARQRAPSLRLWPRAASVGPRVRDVGPNLLVREVRRDTARLAAARIRTCRRSEPERLARRVDALSRVLDSPLPAARRLARELAVRPNLAIRLAARRAPRTRHYNEPECAMAHDHALNRAYDWTMRPLRDTS